jgi:hypothetical protein
MKWSNGIYSRKANNEDYDHDLNVRTYPSGFLFKKHDFVPDRQCPRCKIDKNHPIHGVK